MAVFQVPQGMGYALIGNLPPVYGIYSSFFPPLTYVFMGPARHTSIGTAAIVSGLMTSEIVMYVNNTLSKKAREAAMMGNSTQLMTQLGELRGIDVAVMITFVIGLYMILLGIFQLGFISNYLSQELISGFIAAAAILTLFSQMRFLLGINLSYFSGKFSFIRTLIELFERITEVNFYTLSMTSICVCILLSYKYCIEAKIQRRFNFNFPFPIELTVVIIGTIISSYFDIEHKFDIKTMGTIPKG